MTSNTLNTIVTAVVTLVIIVGIIVLMALGKVAISAGLPIIAALGGLHVGVNVSGSTAPSAPAPAATLATLRQQVTDAGMAPKA